MTDIIADELRPDAGVVETARLVGSRAVSARDVVGATIARIDALDPRLHAFMAVDRDGALDEADRVDALVGRGAALPLAGVTIGIKDLLDIEGQVTGGGMGFRTSPADADATVVARLRAAGAIVIGKLVTTEGATVEHHPSVPRPINPWGAEWWTGISSSGSGVATAARLCHAAIGTDTGGSIRLPAAANGITGIKPSWGRVSRAGLFHLAESLDHVGPLARDAADCAAVLQAIAGRDPRDPTASPVAVGDYAAALTGDLSGLVIGLDPRFVDDGCNAEVAHAVTAAMAVLRDAGASVREVAFPETPAAAADMAAEVAAAHDPLFAANASAYGERLRRMVEHGRAVSGLDVVRGAQARARFLGAMAALMDEVDLLVTPMFPAGPPRVDEVDAAIDDYPELDRIALRFMAPFNMTGQPAIVFPIGRRANAPPMAMQLAARPWREADALRAAHAFQSRTDHHRSRPLVA